MHSECFVATGKIGDVLNVMPLLQLHSLKTGEPVKLVISKRYASICEGLDFIEPIVFDGEFDELSRAIREAKQKFKRVIPLQVYGKDFPFDRHHHSFAIDQWARGGMAPLWGKQGLQYPPCETDFTEFKGAILVADKSESSPFPHIEKLMTRLKAEFPDRKIVPLSTITLPRFQDFIGIYDVAALVISTETAHLHLSAATRTPVIVIATDKPSVWHGTAQRPGLAFHCRYKDYEFREDELIRAAKSAVNNLGAIECREIKTPHPHAYNMGMLTVSNVSIYSYRYHPDPKDWRTRIAIMDGGESRDLVVPGTGGMSLEDARMFMLRGKPHIAYTVSRSVNAQFRSIQAYGPLVKTDAGWMVEKHIVIKRAGNDFTRMEKNWTYFAWGESLYAIYGIVGKNQIVLELNGERVVKEHVSPAPSWRWGEIRGGVVVGGDPSSGDKLHFMYGIAGSDGVVVGGKPMLRLFHSRVGDGHKHFTFRYYIGASLMNPEPPFETVKVSSHPVYAGHEEWVADCERWKPGCALVYGARTTPEGIEASIGINDCKSAILKLKQPDLNL